MKFDINEINKYVKGSDTDSIFITAESILIKKYGDDYEKILSEDQIISQVKEIALIFEKKLNYFLSKRTKELLNVKDNKIEFKTETIIKRVYWAGKRRYAQHIVDKEGLKVNEVDMKGLDIMKSNFPPLFRDFGKTLIEKIIFGEDKLKIDEYIIKFRESLSDIDWKKLLKPTGLKKLKEYIESPPLSGEIFSRLKKKCPINTKAAIWYNDLLKFKKLDKQYPMFQIGDKMYIAYLKNNPYKIEVLGFNGYSDPPEIKEFINTFIDRGQMFDSVLKNKLENLYLDIKWDFPIFNKTILKFFNFN